MAHTVFWPKKKFFYPIGNTPPVSFTQDLALEIPADVLLLGCGDPRSILYTVYTDHGAPNRNLDFTCCDAEPAILARNILLFTLIADCEAPSNIEQVWKIFFHFYLDQSALELLRAQCRKLVRFSTTVQSWAESPYSSFLAVCSTQTLFELRRHWILYEETEDLPEADRQKLRQDFVFGTQAVQAKYNNMFVTTASRSAGPLGPYVVQAGGEHFRHYWATGMTFQESSHQATLINPTFAYSASGRGFNMHYGTDPILAFHLSMVSTLAACNDDIVSMTDVVRVAKSQFRAWCSAFHDRVSKGSRNMVIRFFTGDALAFCRALHFCRENNTTETGLYISPWVDTQINLDGGGYDKRSGHRAPTAFNNIDTSNLTDHLGLLNILLATLPLLMKTPAAVLHTDTLLTSEDTGGSPGGLAYRCCADISTLSLLLGIVPTSFASGFTSHSNAHEVLSVAVPGRPRQEFIVWKMTPGTTDGVGCPLLTFNPQELGKLLFGIYLRMFSDENLLETLEAKAPPNLRTIHYTRASFAAFLSIVKRRISINWVQTMQHMTALIEDERPSSLGAIIIKTSVASFT